MKKYNPQYLAEVLTQTYFLFFVEGEDHELQIESLRMGIGEALTVLFKRMDYAFCKEFVQRFEEDGLLITLLPITLAKCPDVEELVEILPLANDSVFDQLSDPAVKENIASLVSGININELEMMVEDAFAPDTKRARRMEEFINSCR